MICRWKDENEDNEKLNNWCSKYSIKWTFNTTFAPRHNGIVESMVKRVKERVLTEEEHRTIFT